MSQNAAIIGIVIFWCSNFLPLQIPTLGGGAYITSRFTPRELIHHWGDPAQPSTFQNKSLFGLTVFCQSSSSLHGSTENISLPQFWEEMCTPVSNIPLNVKQDWERLVQKCIHLLVNSYWTLAPVSPCGVDVSQLSMPLQDWSTLPLFCAFSLLSIWPILEGL